MGESVSNFLSQAIKVLAPKTTFGLSKKCYFIIFTRPLGSMKSFFVLFFQISFRQLNVCGCDRIEKSWWTKLKFIKADDLWVMKRVEGGSKEGDMSGLHSGVLGTNRLRYFYIWQPHNGYLLRQKNLGFQFFNKLKRGSANRSECQFFRKKFPKIASGTGALAATKGVLQSSSNPWDFAKGCSAPLQKLTEKSSNFTTQQFRTFWNFQM